MPHDAESATEYVALEPTVGRSVLLPANMRVSSFCALIAAVSTLILCLGLRTSSDALLPNAQLQAEPSAAPLLCYEFAATVFKRTTLVGDREKLTSSEMRAIHVSRLGDYVGLLDPPTAPFQKKFRAFWTADRAASASDQSCVALHIMPFFDESICEVQPAKHLNTSVEPSVGCSTRALKRVMPLDASFGKAASSAYVYAKQVSVASDARTTTGGELLQWEAPAMSIDVTEDGVEYSAHMSTRVSYHVSHNSALLSDECVAHAAGKAPRAALLAIESHVAMTIECKSNATTCAAAGSSKPKTAELITESRFEAPPKGQTSAARDVGKPPSFADCVDTRLASTMAGSGGGGTTIGLDSSGGRSGGGGGGSSAGWDEAGWDVATGRIERRGDTDSAQAWLAPPAYLLGHVSDSSAIAALNAQDLGWVAGHSPYFDGESMLAVQLALGARDVIVPDEGADDLGVDLGRMSAGAISLLAASSPTLPSSPHLHELRLAAREGPALPKRFDAREAWPKCAELIGRIRNQGRCGSCWAQGAAESFTDRLCIATDGRTARVELSAQAMVNCDPHDDGCSGGFLDNAWRFLASQGVPSEECVPYEHCANPSMPNCSLGGGGGSREHDKHAPSPPSTPPPPALPPSVPDVCSRCTSGELASSIYRASSVYAVSAIGDAEGMMLELKEHGPFEVGFAVYTDFMHYQSGVYRRSRDARPAGGHAVKLIGWGEEAPPDGKGDPIPYWLLANSWSPSWGEDGFFRIRRGTNEVMIETTPAAGLPNVNDHPHAL